MKQPLMGIARVLAAVALIVALWLGALVLIGVVVGPDGLSGGAGIGSSPSAAFLLFLSFAGLAGGVLFASRLLYDWQFTDLFGPLSAIRRDGPRAFVVAGLAQALMAALVLTSLDLPRQMSIILWLSYLPIAMAGLALQTLSEELAFRAFLPKALQRTGLPMIWSVLIACVIFTLLHTNPDATPTARWGGYLIIFAIALAAADLTWKSGSLVSAWTFHFCNNFTAALLVAPAGKVSGFSLWLAPETAANEVSPLGITIELLTVAVIWFFIRRGLR